VRHHDARYGQLHAKNGTSVQEREDSLWFVCCTNPCMFTTHTLSHVLKGKASGRDVHEGDHARTGIRTRGRAPRPARRSQRSAGRVEVRKLLDHRRGGQGHAAITARFRDGHLPARPRELSVRKGDPLAEGRDIQTIVLRAILHACPFLYRCHRTATRSICARASATCGRRTMIQPPWGTSRSSLIPYAYFVPFYRRKKHIPVG
jgi:hypothetical protein